MKTDLKAAVMNAHVTSVHAIQCKFCPAKYLTKKDMDQHESTTGHLNKPLPFMISASFVKNLRKVQLWMST